MPGRFADALAEAASCLATIREHGVGLYYGAALIDIRSQSQCAADGVAPDAIWIARNVLEWRCVRAVKRATAAWRAAGAGRDAATSG